MKVPARALFLSCRWPPSHCVLNGLSLVHAHGKRERDRDRDTERETEREKKEEEGGEEGEEEEECGFPKASCFVVEVGNSERNVYRS